MYEVFIGSAAPYQQMYQQVQIDTGKQVNHSIVIPFHSGSAVTRDDSNIRASVNIDGAVQPPIATPIARPIPKVIPAAAKPIRS